MSAERLSANDQERLAQYDAEHRPVRASFWFMHDDHTFTKLAGSTVREVAEHATQVRRESLSGGMLCSCILLNAFDREVRRIGEGGLFGAHGNVHCYGRGEVGDEQWAADVEKWIALHEADVDVARCLAPTPSSEPPK